MRGRLRRRIRFLKGEAACFSGAFIVSTDRASLSQVVPTSGMWISPSEVWVGLRDFGLCLLQLLVHFPACRFRHNCPASTCCRLSTVSVSNIHSLARKWALPQMPALPRERHSISLLPGVGEMTARIELVIHSFLCERTLGEVSRAPGQQPSNDDQNNGEPTAMNPN